MGWGSPRLLPRTGARLCQPTQGDSWGRGQGGAGIAEGGTEVLGPIPMESYQALRGKPCFLGFADDAGSYLRYIKYMTNRTRVLGAVLCPPVGAPTASREPLLFSETEGAGVSVTGAPWCPAHSWSSQHHHLPHWTPGTDTPSMCPQKPPAHIATDSMEG